MVLAKNAETWTEGLTTRRYPRHGIILFPNDFRITKRFPTISDDERRFRTMIPIHVQPFPMITIDCHDSRIIFNHFE